MKPDISCPACSAPKAELVFRKEYRKRHYYLAQCVICGQNFCEPKPTVDEISSFYEGDYHVQLRSIGAAEKQFLQKFLSYRSWVLNYIKSGRSLDIGTATGLFPSLLKEIGFDAEGLEFNTRSAQWGETHYGVKIHTNRLEESSAQHESYDFISMTDVLEHAQHPLRFLETVRKYLKPQSFMLITFPDISSIESRYSRLLSIILQRDWIWYCCRIPLHIWEFTPTTARAMFDKGGFDVVGFRRSHDEAENDTSFALRLLFLPIRILNVRALRKLFGSQMEFMLQRRE